eukprot:CAMPEP_0172391928 /NCGR_PEP_ID=MMETSP1061-20121228/8212_1 /TAXON_ID=37318 /ORGANISM="Pseudo-nitzschia pungens, Strain cf. pungens" /LENGTH=384 /DNA_ID=CAMNT_0013122673 /DNA_START=432 /DNA_END=1586 /DNA_ORIENTATION=+
MNHNHEGMHGMDMPMDTNMNMNMDTNMNMNMNMNMDMPMNMDTNMKMNMDMPMNMDLDAHTGMHHDHSGMMTMSSSSSPSSSSTTTTMEAMVDFASDTIASSGHETFCDAGMGMVMYMEGFHWTLAPPRNNNNNNNNHNDNHGQRNCLNLYFESWTLDTRLKFFAAMVLVVVLGIVTEGLGRWKHEVAKQQQQLQQQQQQQLWQSRPRSRSERLYWTHTVLQGLSILSAYLLMLVVMTYSLELFSCVIAGLTIGYRVFGGETFRHGGGGGAGTLCCDFLRDEPQSQSQSQPPSPSPSQTQPDSDSDSDAYTNRRVSLTERLLPRTVEPNGGTLVGATATAGNGYSYYGTNSNGHSCCSSNGSGSGSSSSSGDVEVEVVAGHDDE